jgi:hypothetical protein
MGCTQSTEVLPMHGIPLERIRSRVEIAAVLLKSGLPVAPLLPLLLPGMPPMLPSPLLPSVNSVAAISLATDGTLLRQAGLSDGLEDLKPAPDQPSTALTMPAHRNPSIAWDPVAEVLPRSATRLNLSQLQMQRQLFLYQEFDRRDDAHATSYADSSTTRECVSEWRRRVVAPAW